MLMKVVSRSTIVATIIAVVLASISATGVLAAGTGGTSQNNSTGAISQNEIRDVHAESTFFSNLQKQPIKLSSNASDRAQEQRWLQQYLFALAQAQAIIGGRFGITTVASTGGKSSNSTSSNGTTSSGTTSSTSTSGSSVAVSSFVFGKYYQNNPDKLLAMYLHMMRQLRLKLGTSQ